MASQQDLLAQKNKIQRQILELETSLAADGSVVDLLLSSSDSDDESDDSGHAVEEVVLEDLEAERQQIQREIEALEQTLGADAVLADALTDSEHGIGSHVDSSSDSDELDIPQDVETCLQMNLVYQEVLKEKLAELERLLNDNRQQQKQVEANLSGSAATSPGLPQMKLFLGTFMKPYFKDKVTGLGPPANEETKEKMSHRTRPCDEMKIRRWEGWQKTLLINSVVADTMKRMQQPKMSKMEYLTAKMSRTTGVEKEELQKQISLLEEDIAKIGSMTEDQLYGNRHDDHDWDKIANTDFEGLRSPEDLMRFWQNYLHPSINKSVWKQDEIEKLATVAEEHNCCNWEKIAEALGTSRTAFMCFQTYQRYVAKSFRKREWTKEEDQVLRDLVEKMRIGNFIPYTQLSYFMEGRDHAQLMYRWTCVLDPSLKKGPWSKEEDQLLLNGVEKYGVKDWWKIRLEVPGRTDNACRDRYLDCLRDDVKRGPWSNEEVALLKKLVQKYGVGKWAKISSEIPNRIDSQCLHKWKWIMRTAAKRNGGQLSGQPKSKRRKHKSESSSEDENIEYMDSDDEQVTKQQKGNKTNVPLEDEQEDKREAYIQPDMKEWIPVGGQAEMIKTTIVRLPTEEERQACRKNSTDDGDSESPSKECQRSIRCTMLNQKGFPVKTFISKELQTLDKQDTGHKDTMIKVSLSEVKNLLFRMQASAIKGRTRSKTKGTTLLGKEKKNAHSGKEETSGMKDAQTLKRKDTVRISRARLSTRLNYDLMIAIIPWVGNVLLPLGFSERNVCEADVARSRAADVLLARTEVFTFFLEILRVDVGGCMKVIDSQKLHESTHQPDTQFPSVKTVAMLLAEKKQRMKEGLNTTQLSKLPLPPRPYQNKKPDTRPSLMVPQAFVITQPNTHQGVNTPQSVGQGIQSGVHGPSQCLSQPVFQLVLPIEPGKSAPPTPSKFNPTTTVASTENAQEASKCKPTTKASAMIKKVKTNRSRKKSTRNPLGNCDSPAVAVLPQTTTWILTPAGLMPVTGPSPGITGDQNQAVLRTVPQQALNAPLIFNQNGLVHAVGPSNSTNVTPADATSSSAETSADQRPSVSSLPSVNDSPILSSAVTCTTGVPTTAVPSSVNRSIIASSSANGTSAQEGTIQNLAPSSGSNAVDNSVRISSPCTVKSSPAAQSVQPSALNISVPAAENISAAVFENQNVGKSHVSQQPMVMNLNGSLALISAAGPHLPSSASPNSSAHVSEVLLSPASSSSSSTVSNVPVVQAVTPPPVVNLSMVKQIVPQDKNQSLQTAAVPNPDALSFDSNLMFAEDPAVVKGWMKGSEGISLPQQDNKMPYLPPFVGNISTLVSLLKAKESLLQGAARLLPEEGAGIEEENKVAALRKLVSERFQTNPAHSLLKARFLSCFTLPALLATIHPRKEWKLHSSHKLDSDEDEDDSPDEVELMESGNEDQVQPNGTLCNTNESEASAREFSGMRGRKRSRSINKKQATYST